MHIIYGLFIDFLSWIRIFPLLYTLWLPEDRELWDTCNMVWERANIFMHNSFLVLQILNKFYNQYTLYMHAWIHFLHTIISIRYLGGKCWYLIHNVHVFIFKYWYDLRWDYLLLLYILSCLIHKICSIDVIDRCTFTNEQYYTPSLHLPSNTLYKKLQFA